MKTPLPSLRFLLHQAAVDAYKSEPPPPVSLTKQARREHKDAVKHHYESALLLALEKAFPLTTWANAYQRKIWRGILKRLKGEPSPVQPLFKKENIMPCMREWAEKRGLI